MEILKKQNLSFMILLLFGLLAVSYACDTCKPPTPSPPPPTPSPPPPCPPSPPPHIPKPPTVKPPPTPTPPSTVPFHPPTVKPPPTPPCPPSPPPHTPNPPTVKPPPTPTPTPPVITPPTPTTPTTPETPSAPPPAKTCAIDVLKLGACVEVLKIFGTNDYAKSTCCPIVAGVTGYEAALCLCNAFKSANLPNINDLIAPLTHQILATCGVDLPGGFDLCPSQ